MPFPLARGDTKPTKCPICADKYYASGAMLEHLAWHAVEDKEAASHILQGRARNSPDMPHTPSAPRPRWPCCAAAPADEEEEPRTAPEADRAAQQGSIPAGLAPWPPCGSPQPMAPADLAAQADPAEMPIRDS